MSGALAPVDIDVDNLMERNLRKLRKEAERLKSVSDGTRIWNTRSGTMATALEHADPEMGEILVIYTQERGKMKGQTRRHLWRLQNVRLRPRPRRR